jgi:hypothetical protein
MGGAEDCGKVAIEGANSFLRNKQGVGEEECADDTAANWPQQYLIPSFDTSTLLFNLMRAMSG